MKPGAYFLSFSSPRLYHAIAMSCEIAGFEIRDMINWTYTRSMPKGMSLSHIIKKMNITEEEKNNAIISKIYECHKKGQPILIFTSSINKSEKYSNLLSKKGIKHTVLNAKNHEKEAEVIANAGKKNSVIR